jgi:glycosyltransferase
MKISILTCVLNNEKFIEDSIKSFQNQNYENKEHIIIDGGSTDKTIEIINRFKNNDTNLISSQDNGIYDAINKGINLASGDVIGILHSDDFYTDYDVLFNVNEIFEKKNVDIVYGDLLYVSKNKKLNIRFWRAGEFLDKNMKKGWMPPHPTVFIKKEVFRKIGNYNTDYKISSDYDFLIRVFKDYNIRKEYIKKTLIKMRIGGKSNKSITNLLRKTFEDFKIIKKNKIGGILTLLNKNYSKISQLYQK